MIEFIVSSDDAAEVKASVFEEVLRPRFRRDANQRRAIQIEIHVALSPKEIKASILLNKLRLIGIFDLIMELKSFVFDKIPESEKEDEGRCVFEGEREREAGRQREGEGGREGGRERERERVREREREREYVHLLMKPTSTCTTIVS